ncbi:MAG: hypothetical protein KJ954_01890 [Alphaproteobacteria bacterium]|nr:hypothetical protein [Alphaproteobacteria bacterium]
MSDTEIYPVPAEWAKRAHMDGAAYETARKAAVEAPPLTPAEETALAKVLKSDRLRHEAAADAPDDGR